MRAGLIPQQQTYTFQELGQLRTLRALREEDVSAASIRHSIVAMKAVAGMANPLLEACLVRTGTRLAFRHMGAMVDPIRRQLLFDFERFEHMDRPFAVPEPGPLRRPGAANPSSVQGRFLAAVQAEEAGEKQRAIALYEEILKIDPQYAAAYINLGTINFHLRQFARAEELYRRATEADPGWPSSISAMCWTSCSGSTSPSPHTAAPLRSRPAMPTPTTTWRWLTSAPANTAMLCATGRPTSGSTTPAPGPITPTDKSASSSAAKSSPSPGAQKASFRPARDWRRWNW